ncbi:TPA: MarR family winged helix-turn-helix transcriptional regulator [Neisseria bacilliformis]|uniref:MarR-family transcriptional regulator n=1 Tax=Neisseria bacilliformis ATCC BAA-1200 TaxID=888742 RepID=F2BB46_9NEIS|nr:MarR family winged helix-turn-helix transcriptional regulator [Neisseria bacilliformis]EGF11306.1 MarR-family transcriptional regulator [Neisseria bacilliformis ATCC BAA-1200]QMT48077.1 winged helix-turn-helix transcriptional regulator [Neisseria bacilliformis]
MENQEIPAYNPHQNLDKLGQLLSGINDLYVQWAKSKGIGHTTFIILYTLYYRESCTQKDICDVWNLAKQTVSTQCNELLDQGQINIVQNSENRRQKILSLTEQGCACIHPPAEEMRRAETGAFAALGEDLGRQLIEGAERFYQAFADRIRQEG